jgi:hypothetical protein
VSNLLLTEDELRFMFLNDFVNDFDVLKMLNKLRK